VTTTIHVLVFYIHVSIITLLGGSRKAPIERLRRKTNNFIENILEKGGAECALI